MAGSRDNIQLLLLCQINKLYCIAGNADGEVRVLGLLGMFHAVDQLLCSEHIDIEVMRALVKVSIHAADQRILLLLQRMAQCPGADGLRVGDSVQRILIGNLCNGVEGCQKAFFLCAVGRISAGCEGLVRFSAVRCCAVAFP